MSCEGNVANLVDCARRHAEPGGTLKAHLRTCERCLDRWEAERELSANLDVLRTESGLRRSSAASRLSLMQEFESRHAKVVQPFWYWSFAIAATLLLGVLLAPATITRLHQPETSTLVTETAAVSATDTQADSDSDGFIAVPYAPPLATGELVRIVHTELNPAALASLGVSVDPSWTTQLPADLLEGEDGMPRAVRVSEADLSEGGF